MKITSLIDRVSKLRVLELGLFRRAANSRTPTLPTSAGGLTLIKEGEAETSWVIDSELAEEVQQSLEHSPQPRQATLREWALVDWNGQRTLMGVNVANGHFTRTSRVVEQLSDNCYQTESGSVYTVVGESALRS